METQPLLSFSPVYRSRDWGHSQGRKLAARCLRQTELVGALTPVLAELWSFLTTSCDRVYLIASFPRADGVPPNKLPYGIDSHYIPTPCSAAEIAHFWA